MSRAVFLSVLIAVAASAQPPGNPQVGLDRVAVLQAQDGPAETPPPPPPPPPDAVCAIPLTPIPIRPDTDFAIGRREHSPGGTVRRLRPPAPPCDWGRAAVPFGAREVLEIPLRLAPGR